MVNTTISDKSSWDTELERPQKDEGNDFEH